MRSWLPAGTPAYRIAISTSCVRDARRMLLSRETSSGMIVQHEFPPGRRSRTGRFVKTSCVLVTVGVPDGCADAGLAQICCAAPVGVHGRFPAICGVPERCRPESRYTWTHYACVPGDFEMDFRLRPTPAGWCS